MGESVGFGLPGGAVCELGGGGAGLPQARNEARRLAPAALLHQNGRRRKFGRAGPFEPGSERGDFIEEIQCKSDAREVHFEIPGEPKGYESPAQGGAGEAPLLGCAARGLEDPLEHPRPDLRFGNLRGLAQLDQGEMDLLFHHEAARRIVSRQGLIPFFRGD